MRHIRPIYFINIVLLLVAVALTILWATSSKPSAMENPVPLTALTIKTIKTEKPADIRPLNFYQEVVMKRNIFSKVIPKPTVTVISPQTRFKLNGVVFDATHLSAAFILDTIKHVDSVYYESDPLDEWTIKKIEKKRVILVNEAKEEAILTLTPDTVSQASITKPNPVKTPSNPQPQKDDFKSYKTAETPRINPERVAEVTKGIKEILKSTSPEFIYNKIEEYADISRSEISPNVKLEDYATRLLLANEGSALPGEGEKVTFGTTVKQDNTPINSSATFNSTNDKRIYASFSNSGLLQGLSKVVTRWMNVSDGTVAYLGTQPINTTAPNNFIYVEKANGWDKGTYQVELFKVDTMEKVAQSSFEIK